MLLFDHRQLFCKLFRDLLPDPVLLLQHFHIQLLDPLSVRLSQGMQLSHKMLGNYDSMNSQLAFGVQPQH